METGLSIWALNNISFVGGAHANDSGDEFNITSEVDKWVEQATVPTPFDYKKDAFTETLVDHGQEGRAYHPGAKREVIEIVLQNTLALAGGQELHPRVRERDFFLKCLRACFSLLAYGKFLNNCASNFVVVDPCSYSQHLHLHNL